MKELWSLVHWLYQSVFLPSTQRLFQESFDLSRGSYSLQFLKAAKNLLATIMLRRTKSVVEMSVPPKEELTVFVPLTEAQRFWTYRLLTRMDKLDLKQIFVTKSGSDQVVDEGRRQVQEQLRDQVLQNKHSEKPGITVPFCDSTAYNLVNSFSLEEVDEPAHAAAQGLRSVSASLMLYGWFADASLQSIFTF